LALLKLLPVHSHRKSVVVRFRELEMIFVTLDLTLLGWLQKPQNDELSRALMRFPYRMSTRKKTMEKRDGDGFYREKVFN